ncbi:major facilitator superfamily domain-containing protein YCR023C [Trichomonascus vanleenenianus]|uniref:MFS transporter n=1 Tax=Trichomonascus vanleenenianus TaxID=2268995 RepID=UPI003EC96171
MKSRLAKSSFKGMPWGQLLVVAAMRFAEPISFTSLFPYIYFMVKSFEICPEHQIARYAGYISGAFALCQCFTGILWGRLSDKYGRKPIILIGLTGATISMFTFGLSTNFYTALFARCLAGLLNGNVGVIRTLLGEIAQKREHQAVAFSIMPLLWQIGCVIGPMVGGYLEQPVAHHPEWFEPGSDSHKIFSKYPFLLPNLVVSSVLLLGLFNCFFFLKETHELRKHDYDPGLAITRKVSSSVRRLLRLKSHEPKKSKDAENEPLLRQESEDSIFSQQTLCHDSPPSSKVEEVDESWGAVLSPSVINILFSAGFIALHACVYEELLPVFFSSAPEESHFPFKLAGGMGKSAEEVGNLLSSQGFVGIFIMVFVFPWIDAHFGTLTIYRTWIVLFPIVYFAVPYFVLLNGQPKFIQDSILLFNLFFRTLTNSLSHPSMLLLANRAPRHTRHLGVVNGCVIVASAFARAIGPIIWGLLMTAGQSMGYIQLPWWCLAALALVGAIQSRYITDKDDDGNEIK